MDTTTVRTRRMLVAEGLNDRGLRRAVETRQLARVRRGHYVERHEWDESFAEGRERVLAAAARHAARGEPVFSPTTAAAIWRLPLSRHQPSLPHVMANHQTSGSVTRALHRHRNEWDGEFDEIDGLRVTSLPRTVFDVIRTTRMETAIVCADAALRRAAVAEGSRQVSHVGAEGLRDAVQEIIVASRGVRGIVQARTIMEMADARSESPGESISRLYLLQAGFRGIELQTRVPSPSGSDYEVDFDFCGVFGEFDGTVKYEGGQGAQAVVEEKRREDWIRALTGRRVVRWGAPEIRDREALRAYLFRLGVTPQRSG